MTRNATGMMSVVRASFMVPDPEFTAQAAVAAVLEEHDSDPAELPADVLAAEGLDAPGIDAEAVAAYLVETQTVAELTDWAGDDPERHSLLATAEQARAKPRTTLLDHLTTEPN